MTPKEIIDELVSLNYWIDVNEENKIEYGYIAPGEPPARGLLLLKKIRKNKYEVIDYLKEIIPKVEIVGAEPLPESAAHPLWPEILKAAYKKDIFLWGWLSEFREAGLTVVSEDEGLRLEPKIPSERWSNKKAWRKDRRVLIHYKDLVIEILEKVNPEGV